MNGQDLFGGYTARPITGERFPRRKKAGLTGDDYADILKSKAFLKMDPLQQIEIRKIIQETKGLRAEEFRKAEAHKEEMGTQRRATELEENIRNILTSDRTPAQKAIALWYNLGIPKKQANAMVWGERPEGEAEERVPTRREQKLAAIGRDEDVTGRLPGTLIGKPPTERFPVWSAPEDITGAAERAEKVRGVRRGEAEARDEARRKRRMGGYLEMGAKGDWTKDEVMSALIGEGMPADEATTATEHLPSTVELEAKREAERAAIDVRGEEMKKAKIAERDKERARIRRQGIEKRVPDYFAMYQSGDWTKNDLVGALAGEGISAGDASTLTGHLPSQWEKKEATAQERKDAEKAALDAKKHAFNVVKYNDAQAVIERDYEDEKITKGEERATKDRDFKKWRLDKEFDFMKLFMDADFDMEDFAPAITGLFGIFDENIANDKRVGDALGSLIEITDEQEEQAIALYETTKGPQIKLIDDAVAKEGMTDTSDYQIKIIALAELGRDIKQLGLEDTVKKWSKPKQWWFQAGKTPFTNKESQAVFREAIEKYAHEATTEGMMGLTENVILENMSKKSATLAKDIKALAKKGEPVEIPLPPSFSAALTGLSPEVTNEAMACYKSIWNSKGKLDEPTPGQVKDLVTMTCGRRPDNKEKEHETPEYKEALPVNVESDSEYASLITGMAQLTREQKGWLLMKRFSPEMWKDFQDIASARGNYLLRTGGVELDTGPTFGERLARGMKAGIERGIELLLPDYWWNKPKPVTSPRIGEGVTLPTIDNAAEQIATTQKITTQSELYKKLQESGFANGEIDDYFEAEMAKRR